MTVEDMDGSESWERLYNSCPLWGYLFHETQDPDTEWPRGVRWVMGRLFFWEKLCIPLCLQKPFIQKTHACLGHVGGKRLWEQMLLTTEWAQEDEARRFTMCVSRQCETCQACVRPPRLHTRFSHTPISARIMVSVALDIFWLPLVLPHGKRFGSVAVCVDRHSGWIVAVLCLNKGLTGALVAQRMLKWQWRPQK